VVEEHLNYNSYGNITVKLGCIKRDTPRLSRQYKIISIHLERAYSLWFNLREVLTLDPSL